MTTEQTLTKIADAYWTMTPGDFEAWLQSQAMEYGHECDYELVLGGYLAGNLGDDWARDHASPETLSQ